MNDKYYTPEIEELHVSFEHEIKRKDGTKWIKQNPSRTDWNTDFEKFDYRVKYLDREDIESAFERNKHFVCRGNAEGGNDYFINNDKDRMLHNIYTHRCVIEIWDNERKDNYVAFVGTIKNKSELKRIMKMIGI